jgi:uncharacterized RDD family membrane protein YckC
MISEKYQTFWRRFWAGFVDALVLAPLMIADHFFWRGAGPVAIRAAWTLILSFLPYAYAVVGHGLYGQTVGKWLLGIRVLDVTETRLGMHQAFARESVPIGLLAWQTAENLDSILQGIRQSPPRGHGPGLPGWVAVGWFVLELVTMLASPRRRTMHDLIAGSVVVRLASGRGRWLSAGKTPSGRQATELMFGGGRGSANP